MGYRRMTVAILKNIYRRWDSGQNLSEIERTEQVTRKTIRGYIKLFQNAQESDLLPENLGFFLDSIIGKKNLKTDSFEIRILPYIDEIRNLIEHPEEPVKRKTAWMIIKGKYNLSGSYESFKIFTRKYKITQKEPPSTIRIETNPGDEIQIDYGKVGTLFDPLTDRNRTVWCFAGNLSHSRHIFPEYVFSQDQESFVSSHVKMFTFFGGVTQYLTIDNLKSGVIKPDYYDPQINRAYQQMAEYYDTFINPCLPASPKQKGKIERSMPVVRELFRRLKNINPTYTLSQLNKEALKWSLVEYGLTKHGTTGEEPILRFKREEQKVLKQLPATPFTIPHWKVVTVHWDQFFIFEKRYYSMPKDYRRKKLNACRSGAMLQVYDGFKLIRQYLTTGERKKYRSEDFPEGLDKIVEGSYIDWLVKKAGVMGSYSEQLLKIILEPEAALNARRARGVLSIMEEYCKMDFFQDTCRRAVEKRIKTPKKLKELMEFDSHQMSLAFVKEVSKEQKEMTRDIEYYMT